MIVTSKDVFCDGDGCLAWTEGGTGITAVEARRDARGRGWVHHGGRDLCPACARDEARR